MIELEKLEENNEIANVSTQYHPEFIERKKPTPILKKKPLPSFGWLGELLEFLFDLFTW